MKVLNLEAGVGGNRLLWPAEFKVTAVELNPRIAEIYQDLYKNDIVIVGDAGEYLLKHFREFDFVWSSPPCPTHSRMRMLWKGSGKNINGKVSGESIKYPDMTLYQRIIFLQHFFEGKYCVENVISYYKPLLPPIESGSHYYWTNFYFKPLPNMTRHTRDEDKEIRYKKVGIDLSKYNLPKRMQRDLINNCVEPAHGKYILDCAMDITEPTPMTFFDELPSKNTG